VECTEFPNSVKTSEAGSRPRKEGERKVKEPSVSAPLVFRTEGVGGNSKEKTGKKKRPEDWETDLRKRWSKQEETLEGGTEWTNSKAFL